MFEPKLSYNTISLMVGPDCDSSTVLMTYSNWRIIVGQIQHLANSRGLYSIERHSSVNIKLEKSIFLYFLTIFQHFRLLLLVERWPCLGRLVL